MAPSWLLRLGRLNLTNYYTFRDAPLAEISGSLGDLGTLLPLMIALARQDSIDLGSTLVFSGIFNILTGLIFGIPLPVQPMKALASAAISRPEDSSILVVTAAGQLVALAVLFLSITGLLRFAVTAVPVPVVKGIQLGAGLSLVIGAGTSLLQPLHWIHPVLDNRVWATVAFLALVGTQQMKRFPYALCFFVLAVAFAFVAVAKHGDALPGVHLWRPEFVIPSWFVKSPAVFMAIGQLPLTTLNSIIAVSALANDLLPDLPTPSVTSMGLSVALMNLTGSWFGAMPVCHGAGGLAAQFRFGARSGSSVIFLGIIKILLGLFFGKSLISLLAHYPNSILGIMVLAAGLELAKVGYSLNKGAPDLWETSVEQDNDGLEGWERRQRGLTDDERLERWTVMLMTAGALLAFRNDAVGFAAGMLCHWSFALSDRFAKWRESRRSEFSTERDPLLR
ncbi:hypothetical protein NLU13_6295 [Sarocladium strictum]|uniref:Sulfate transporter n=1 Tax=Sarocladium strictum TaxID=5046 RepID=A0AA39GGC6_SARSR|nr:hypothetical protein NLU13_6295 [Sarocladium strictum]